MTSPAWSCGIAWYQVSAGCDGTAKDSWLVMLGGGESQVSDLQPAKDMH